MQKTAQERSILNKLREKINMPSSQLDKFFNPQMEKVMGKLKETDDQIRAYLSGKIIGDANPLDSLSAKDLLKSAQSNFNRREYMAGVAELGRFHKLMFDVSKAIAGFQVDVNQIHHKFLFDGIKDTEHDANLKRLREHMDSLNQKTASAHPYFIKEAGIMDFFYNMGTKRGRSLAAWEKRYPDQIKKLRDEGSKLIRDGHALLENTLGHLKVMATARATRNPDVYADTAKKITAGYSKFDAGFKAYYGSEITKWLKLRDETEAKEKAERESEEAPSAPTVSVPDASQIGDQEVPTQESPVSDTDTDTDTESEALPLVNKQPYADLKTTQRPQALPPAIPNAPVPEDLAPDTEKIPSTVRSAHSKFLQSLESMSDESPSILAGYISKYASQIQKSDSDSAIKLFQMARQIKEQI